jgi:hypothetical protein
LKKESTEQTERRLELKKAALKARSKSMKPKEESTMLRARKANIAKTRSGSRVRPMKDFTSKKTDPYANPNE